MKKNFGLETRDVIRQFGYSLDDIKWIGNNNYKLDIDDFFYRADGFFYDAGYGLQVIPLDLKIFMNDGAWFTRQEYDGSEWWGYIKAIKEPQKVVKLIDINSQTFYEPILDNWIEKE